MIQRAGGSGNAVRERKSNRRLHRPKRKLEASFPTAVSSGPKRERDVADEDPNILPMYRVAVSRASRQSI